MGKLLITLVLVTFLLSTSFAGSIKGIVTGASDDAPMIGANVYLQGTILGAATDEEGIYLISDVEDGTYILVCDYVGYATQEVEITVAGDVEHNFVMVEFLFSKTISVIADRARDRETPVAFTNVSKAKIEEQLGSQDIPMVLNTTPSVYATMSGGGAGDARINVRGFNQRNLAVMINGVPVNDMENGWVYWSNWDGLGDATSSIQMQRGLSAVNLATPSIGGTMNIITDPTALNAGVKVKSEFGSGSLFKNTIMVNSGLIDGKYAVSGTVVRKVGEGVIDKTWTDAWAYYFGASYNINEDNRLELFALGAPQRHGQNLYKQNIGAYSHSFARDLDDYDPAALALDKFPESDRGRKYNETWGPVSSSYKGKQAIKGDTFSRYDKGFINERENFFHKPQVSMNWYSNLTADLGLASVLYYSGGTGGGTGTRGSLVWNDSPPSRFADWDATIARNDTSTTGSTGILRNSRNDQYTIGLISKLNYRVNDNLKTTVGIDWRTAEIDHYREVRDLLGGDFYIPSASDQSDFWSEEEKKRGLGDKMGYFNTNQVDWIGGFAQAEYTMDQWTMYGTFGISSISYSYVDHFKKADDGGEFKLDSDPEYGIQVKGGAMYRINDAMEVYGNAGYVEKVPIFDNVIDDRNGVFAEKPETEKFTSFEAGLNWRGLDGTLSAKSSFYFTTWEDRALPRTIETSPGVFDILFLTGLNQQHIGFEFEAAYQPIPMFRLDLAGSIANWELTDDASGTYKENESGVSMTQKYFVGVKGLKIGDAPQTQLALAGTVFPVQGMSAQLVFKYYDEFYADWDPTSRIVTNSAGADRGQSWKIPSYSLIDLHASYLLPFDLNGVTFKVSAHVFNLLDEEYISDALDNSSFNSYKVTDVNDRDGDGRTDDTVIANPHKADAAEVYLGLPRTINIGITLNY